MKVRRYVPWGDIWWFGALSLLCTGLGIGAWLTPQEWELMGIVMLVGVISGIWLLSLIVVLTAKLRGPTFILDKADVAVWTNGIVDITPELVLGVLDCFKSVMATRLAIPGDVLAGKMRGMSVEFRKEKMNRWWRKETPEDEPLVGVQQGKSIIVWWPGWVTKSALFHELLHLLREELYRDADPGHTDDEWWGHEVFLKQAYCARN